MSPSWAHLGALLGVLGAHKCNAYEGFLMFLRIHFYLLQMPKMIPSGPQEGVKRTPKEPKRGPQASKRGQRRPQNGPKTTLRQLQDGPNGVPGPPSRCQGVPVMFMTAVAAQRSPQEGPRTPPDPRKDLPMGPKRASKRPLSFNISTQRECVSSATCIYIYMYIDICTCIYIYIYVHKTKHQS